jgi:endogenous inhibitor of DNA gyrase (YacG/DUF329 family)
VTTCRRHDDCPERPCRVCRREHVTHNGHGTDHTCATCLHETRRNLAELGNLAAAMLGEAIIRGLQSQAAVLAGPTADPAKWHRRAVLIAKAATYADAKTPAAARLDALLEDNRDEPHPGWILRDWERQVRDHLNQTTDDPATLTDARRYLDGHLTRLAHDETFAFEELARDIKACRTHCEAVLHDDEQTERGAPCPTCRRPLERVEADGHIWFACDRCATLLHEAAYWRTVREQHIAKADRLNAEDMATRTGVSASSIRTWANERTTGAGEHQVVHPPLLRSCGVDGKGRKVYRVSEVERVRDSGGDTRGRKPATCGG